MERTGVIEDLPVSRAFILTSDSTLNFSYIALQEHQLQDNQRIIRCKKVNNVFVDCPET